MREGWGHPKPKRKMTGYLSRQVTNSARESERLGTVERLRVSLRFFDALLKKNPAHPRLILGRPVAVFLSCANQRHIDNAREGETLSEP